MLTENVNFGRYGKAFQEGLVQLIFEDRPFADQITEVLDIQFLELEYLRVFVNKIIDKDNQGIWIEWLNHFLYKKMPNFDSGGNASFKEGGPRTLYKDWFSK